MNTSPVPSSDINILSYYQVEEPKTYIKGVHKRQVQEEGDRITNKGNVLWEALEHTPYNRMHNKEVTGVLNQDGKQKLVTVNTKDITKWQVFLSWFGLGKLAHIDVTLNGVINYLAKYKDQWKQFEKMDPNSAEYKAAVTVCKLAGLQMLHRTAGSHSTDLWKALSNKVETSHGEFYVNPGCTFRHIQYQEKIQEYTNERFRSWDMLIKTNESGKEIEKPAPDQPMTSKEEIEAYNTEKKSETEWL